MDKKSFDKLKDKIPDMGHFARRHMSETLMGAALVVGAFSAWQAMFVGGTFITFLFLIAGTLVAIFFPEQVDGALTKGCKSIYRKDKMSEIIVGSIMVVIALFVPFLYFGFMGLFAGSAYHYYTRYKA